MPNKLHINDNLCSLRSSIGATVRELREARRWTQTELAGRLRLSQPRLSHIEHGTSSLTAEQFLEVLRIFNVPASTLVAPGPDDDVQVLQNALARLGARHLHISDRTLPSDRVARPHDAIFETLISREARLMTALAPVLVENAETLNLTRLSVDLDTVGLRRRLYWVLENTLEAIRQDVQRPGLRRDATYARATRMLETALAFARGYEKHVVNLLDVLDRNIRSKQTAERVQASSSEISKRWWIVSSLQPADFATALREARAIDQR